MSYFFKFKSSKFPKVGKNIFFNFKKIIDLSKTLHKFKNENKSKGALGHLMTYPSFWSNFVWKALLPYNPGNLGNWSIPNKKFFSPTGSFESEVVAQVLDLYKLSIKDFGGYFTSGATEANIYSAWLGRKKLENDLKNNDICVLRSCLSHYSIAKAADVVGLNSYEVSINDDWTGISTNALKRKLISLYKKGYRGFLLPLTYGFTLTGTSDKISEIIDELNSFKNTYKGVKFFLWLDAAFAGLVQPFLDEKWTRLPEEIELIAIDFHKFGFSPQPSGLVLYRHDLLSLVKKKIDYLEQDDSTLLGSRTGIAPVAAWFNIQNFGFKGWKKKVSKSLLSKNEFIRKYSKYDGLQIITSSSSLNLGLILNKKERYWSKYFKENYDIFFKKVSVNFSSGKKSILIGKVFFTS